MSASLEKDQVGALGWHAEAVAATIDGLDTTANGLTDAEAAARAVRFGRNELPGQLRAGPLKRFLAQFNNLLIYILIAAAAITGVLGQIKDTLVILAVVLVNAAIGFIQEGRAEAAIAALQRMLAPMASVLRGNRRRRIDAADLVPGDIILIEAGDRVPADARLIEATALKVQEAILSGESVPVTKSVKPVAFDAALGERASMIYSGTLVVSGQGRAIVTATGSEAEIGRISGLLAGVEELMTPLLKKMGVFARWITALILSGAVLLLVYGFFVQHLPFEALFMVVVSLSVAAIPEGLPAVLTITLAIGVRKMSDRHAIVRRLPAIETLGALTVICTDKTGTLTRNEMMVASVSAQGRRFTVEGDGYQTEGQIVAVNGGEDDGLSGLIAAGVLCNDAGIAAGVDGVLSASGDPMEAALLVLADKAGTPHNVLRAKWTREALLPFDAARRYMATLDKSAEGAFIHLKGAPEAVLSMCASQAGNCGEIPLDQAYWEAETVRIAALGQRVIALAAKPVPKAEAALNQSALAEGLVLLGMVGLIDPPRAEAVAAVAECQGAGITVKMITGDHAATAAAIAADVGLSNADRVLTGQDLDGLDDAMLMQKAEITSVFARTTPEHKLRLVTALQARGHIVAMTGDGVNDTPALKRANAGVAMGITGSDAAKEVADLILTDDNFVSIAAAVREGRTVFDNIRKVISWTLPTNAGEAGIIILALVLGLVIPFSALQILWINLVTAGSLGVALAFERPEKAVMHQPPLPADAPILDRVLVWHIALVTVLFLAAVYGVFNYATDRGYSLELARTLTVNMLIILEIFHLFYIRNFHTTSLTWEALRGTPAVWACLLVVVAGQLLFTYAPFMQEVFGTRAVTLTDGAILIGVGAAFFAILEMEKQLRLRLKRVKLKQFNQPSLGGPI
ncbi:HAD-IC family P-type ATPase [Leisingera aquimarina]|uniref:HAD-IC family P-type ATPase n=1 Tax=Leisingera aquimarina TaxID=476529 RepID=UPI0004274004